MLITKTFTGKTHKNICKIAMRAFLQGIDMGKKPQIFMPSMFKGRTDGTFHAVVILQK